MITLLTKQDLLKLDDEQIHPHIALYLKDYFSHMLKQFNCENLAPYGGIMLLESAEDVVLLEKMGMRRDMLYDTAVRHVLDGKTDLFQILYKYFGKAVIIFAVPEIAEPIVEKEYNAYKEKGQCV